MLTLTIELQQQDCCFSKLKKWKKCIMKKISLLYLVLALTLLHHHSAKAEVKLPAILSSNMVLQRNTTVVLWGWADPNEKIYIKTSWSKKTFKIQADEQGNWEIKVETTNSKEPQTIVFKGKESDIKVENVLFGEVWLCSGQSNMQMPLKGFAGQPTFGSAMAIAKAKNSNLRLFKIDTASSRTPLSDLVTNKTWQQSTPESAAEFSAVAYFYGNQLQEILDVPVGLIQSAWGGSTVRAWISHEALSEIEEIDLNTLDSFIKPNLIPTVLFNAMIHPIIPFTIKGVLWYQGENNRNEPVQYKKLLPTMVQDWRNRWEIGNFPFYYVQISPFKYSSYTAFQEVENTAFMRESMLQCLSLIPNSGIAITSDVGDEFSIHPPNKKEVADRLLFNALHKTYGNKAVDFSGPVFDTLIVRNKGIILSFKYAENGLYSFQKNIDGFEIAGENKVFFPAQAKIIYRKNVRVESDSVPNPVAVRYAWRNWVNATLFDVNLLPASSFRTDNWEDATVKL